jgi:hypothetical protein
MEPDIYVSKQTNKNTIIKENIQSTIRKYSIDDFNKFRQSMKIQIPQVIIDKIKFIYNETVKSKTDYVNNKIKAYNADMPVNGPFFNTAPDRKRKHTTHELTDEDWEKMRNFKITQKDKKAGIEKAYDEIRSLLNKLTNDTYDEIKTDIINIINSFVNADEEKCSYYDFGIIIEIVFEIVKANSFYSKLYTNFLCHLFNVSPFFIQWFVDNYNKLIESLYDVEFNKNDIRVGNSDKDYDAFCKINKENEQRRNLALFFCDIKNSNIAFIEDMDNNHYDAFEYLSKYYELFIDYGSDSDTHEQCNEACEVFCILYKNLYTYLKNKNDDVLTEKLRNDICNNIKTITHLKRSELKSQYPGLSTKTMFKLMDIDLCF